MGEDQKPGVILGVPGGDPGPPLPRQPLPMPVAIATLRPLLRPLAALTGLYTAVLVFATHYPRPEHLLGVNRPPDKMLHFLAYGALGLLAAALLAVAGRWSPVRVAILAAGLAAFAAIDEVTQPWFGRTAEPLDWVYDLIGVATGIAVIAVARWCRCGAPRSPGHKPGDAGRRPA